MIEQVVYWVAEKLLIVMAGMFVGLCIGIPIRRYLDARDMKRWKRDREQAKKLQGPSASRLP